MRNKILIYLGFVFIFLGGFFTTLRGEEGFIELKIGQTADGFYKEDDLFQPMDFSINLKDFSVEFYPEQKKGMRFVKSYKSLVTISKEGNIFKEGAIEVNRPLNFGGYSFYQYGYDVDLPDQTVLQVVKDPGLAFAYSGYAVLLMGLILSFKKVFLIV